jgi:hypothetical protein
MVAGVFAQEGTHEHDTDVRHAGVRQTQPEVLATTATSDGLAWSPLRVAAMR